MYKLNDYLNAEESIHISLVNGGGAVGDIIIVDTLGILLTVTQVQKRTADVEELTNKYHRWTQLDKFYPWSQIAEVTFVERGGKHFPRHKNDVEYAYFECDDNCKFHEEDKDFYIEGGDF